MALTKKRKPENLYQNWRILKIARRKADRQLLQRLLLSERALSLAAHSILNYLLTPPAGRKLPRCHTVLVEQEYFDEDFVDSTASFYVRGFRDTGKMCKRLHFFSQDLSPADLRILDKFQDSYMGFCVIRPLATRPIGRTVLKPYRDNREFDFPTCLGPFEANVAGAKLTVDGCCFMEQDGRVQTCSSVAVWISTTTLSQRFGFARYTTAEIMDKATKTMVGQRAGPTEGLTYEQIMLALREMGYDPIIFPETDRLEASYRIYSYIESGIPVILLLEFPDRSHHAVVAIGHGHTRPLQPKWKISMSWLGRKILNYYRSSEWVPYFHIHDDQRGVSRSLRLIDLEAGGLRERIEEAYRTAFVKMPITVDLEQWHCPVSIQLDSPVSGIPPEEIANLWGLIVPLPRGVTLSHSEAESKCVWMMRFCADRLGLKIPKDLVLRTYLARSNDYKLRLGGSIDMDAWTRALYRGKSMPKWLWITEITTVKLMNSPKVDDMRITGELILDATSNPWPTDFVAFHCIDQEGKGHVATMLRSDADVADALARWWIGPETPYRPLIR